MLSWFHCRKQSLKSRVPQWGQTHPDLGKALPPQDLPFLLCKDRLSPRDVGVGQLRFP